MNIANKLTLSRILLIPIYIALFLADFNGHYFYAVAVYALASFTDFLDGYLARSRNLISSFGKFADPLADKMLVTAALLCFMLIGRINVWVVFSIVTLMQTYAGFVQYIQNAGKT
jgi:CDP-diacylglycerol--glycerol-3-phosphate 3-phosphatidyltransferase